MASKPAVEAQDIQSDAPNMTALTLQDTHDKVPRSPTQSEGDSIHSCSEHSETSTLKYDQESYDLFKARVEKLCESLWPPRRSIKQSLSNSKLAARMRANGFLRLFVPSPIQEGPLIERLKGGDYNRITGITLPLAKGEEDRNRNLILRVPRWGQGRTERVAATLDYVRQNSSIPVATIIAKDFSNDDPLKSPYILQSRISGCNLEVLWTDLSHSQRCTVAREIGRVIRSLMTLESPVTGHVEASSRDTENAKLYTIVPFDLKNVDGDLFEEPEQQSSQITGAPRHDDVLTWPYEMPGADDVPSTPVRRELKGIFEECAGPEYLSLAYDEQFRMSRGLFRIAVFGLTSSENYSAADRIVGDWQKLRRSLTQ